MNFNDLKQHNYFKGLVALTGLLLTIYGVLHIDSLTDITFAVGALLLAVTIFAADDILEQLFKFRNSVRLSDRQRKSLQHLRKSLSDFNRISDTPYSSFSEAGVNHKKTNNKLARKLRRKNYGEIRALFGWKKAAALPMPESTAHVAIDTALAKPAALMRNFMMGANRVVVVEWPNGAFETVTLVAAALAKTEPQRHTATAHMPQQHPTASNPFNAANDATEEEIEESLRDIWGLNTGLRSDDDEDGSGSQTTRAPVIPPHGGGGF